MLAQLNKVINNETMHTCVHAHQQTHNTNKYTYMYRHLFNIMITLFANKFTMEKHSYGNIDIF